MRKPLVHFFFWAIFFLIWDRIMYFYIDNGLNRFLFSALDVSLIIISFYVIYLYIIPDYFNRKSILVLIILSGSLVIFLSGGYAWLMWLLLQKSIVLVHFSFLWNYKDLQYNKLFVALLGVFAGCFVKMAIDRMEVSKRVESLEKERSLAELTYLKAQINPHFLFNSLNSLYAQLEINSSDAQKTLSSISDLLRYQLYDCNSDFISLDKEIAYLKNYFTLYSIRKDNCKTELLIKEPPEELLIAPLLLIPFIENAFKYVSDYDSGENFIKANLNFDANKLIFSCTNTTTGFNTMQNVELYKGIGLANVKKRLELIYGKDYQLQVTANNNLYTVDLTIILK